MATRGGAFRASHPPTPPLPAPQRKVTLGLRDLRVFFPRFPWASMARGVRGAGSLGEAEVQEDTQAILRPSLTLALCASPIARTPRCAHVAGQGRKHCPQTFQPSPTSVEHTLCLPISWAQTSCS